VDEFSKDQVRSRAVGVFALLANAAFGFRFDVGHRFADRRVKRLPDRSLAAHCVKQRHGFRHREIEIVTDRSIFAGARREPAVTIRPQIIAQRIEVGLFDAAIQAKQHRTPTTPYSRFHTLAVIVGG